MKLGEVLSGIRIVSTNCDMGTEVSGVECDSRKVSEGLLFFAIKGFKQDGNKYIPDALINGACAIVSEEAPKDRSIPYIQVINARFALADAAVNFHGHPSATMKIIGVTGTNGKTTVTYLIKHVLEKNGASVGLIGTNQNMIKERVLHTERTTPESHELQALLRKMADEGCTHVVMEVSSHSLVLGRVRGITFDIGVFTNVSQDHLDFHESMDDYISAKAKLFLQSRIGVVNIDDEAGREIIRETRCEFVTYSAERNSADVVAKNIRLKPALAEFEAVGYDSICRIEMNVPGRFSVYNALAAITALLVLGFGLNDIAAALKQVRGVKGRAEIVSVPAEYTVMIDYAHTPDGLANILKTVKDFAEGQVWAVFGCGGDRDRTKRPEMGKTAALYADVVVVTSDNPRTEDKNAIIDDIIPGILRVRKDYTVIPDRREAIFYALANAKKDDIIVLAGKGHETYQEINHIKYHMDEREIVAEFFNE